MTKVFIPGKLFLAGEYAITHPGNTAIIAATTTGLSVEITPSNTKSSAYSNTLPKQWHFEINHTENQYTDDWRYVRAAIKIIHDYVKINTNNNHFNEVMMTITSNLNGPFGKIGLGSSAAVV
ncbi:MAG: phosphomevalonate kinase, partial [Leuconostoc gelidum]